MKEVRLIKQLQTQLNTLLTDAEALKIEVANKNKEYVQKLDSIKELKSQIKKLDSGDTLKVSEHALVRYFERVEGYDIEKIEAEILSDEIRKMVGVLGGSGSFPNKDYSVVMKNNTVVTINK